MFGQYRLLLRLLNRSVFSIRHRLSNKKGILQPGKVSQTRQHEAFIYVSWKKLAWRMRLLTRPLRYGLQQYSISAHFAIQNF
jgi:hypothetical protein